MKPVRTIYIKNGDELEPFRIYRCERCDMEIKESWGYHEGEDGVYCDDCAFIIGLIPEEEYIRYCGITLPGMRAAVRDGKIYVESHNRKFPWEKTNKQNRQTKKYTDWRTAVFKRDNFTCQICGQVGGTLNAHHIKPFATNKKLRYDVDNGVTLCEKCHKKVHKEKDEKWIK